MNFCAGFDCSLDLFNAELSPALPVGTQMVEEPQNVVRLFEEHQSMVPTVGRSSKHNYSC